jgi:hypothetical protein
MNVYGISSTAVVIFIPHILGHQSIVCVNRVHHLKERLVSGIWEEEVMLAFR